MPALIKKIFFYYLFPRHLGTQLTLICSLAVASILVIHTIHDTDEYFDNTINNSIAQGKTLARNIAAISPSLLYEKDFAALERILIQSAAFPNISGIQVTNQHGMVISDVRKNTAGKVEAFFEQSITTPPSDEDEILRVSSNDVYVWEPVGSGLGWVKVKYSIEHLDTRRLNAIKNSLTKLAIALAMTIMLLALFLRTPIRTLKSIARFTKTLGENKNARLEEKYSSVEIQSLIDALNTASEKMYAHNQAAHEEIDKLGAYKFSTDQHSIVSITRANGRITYVNDNFSNISGYSKTDLVNQNHNMLASGVHSKEFFRDMWQTILDGKVWHGELCNKNRFGKLYWVNNTIVPILDENGTPYQFISVANDITEERKYRATLEQLSAFPQHNPHVTISVDANGELMYTNMAAVKLMVQLTLSNKSIMRMLPEDMMAFIKASLESDTVIRDIEVEVLGMNWLWSIHPITEQNLVLCYAVDITDSKASQHKQRKAYEALELGYQELKSRLAQYETARQAGDSLRSKSSTKS